MLRSFLIGDLVCRNISQDTPVGILLHHTAPAVLTLLGLQSRGIVPAMLNYTMGEKSVAAAVENAAIQTIITARRFIEKAGL